MGSPLEPLVVTSACCVREGGAAGDSCVPDGEPAGGRPVCICGSAVKASPRVHGSVTHPKPCCLGPLMSHKWHTVQELRLPRVPRYTLPPSRQKWKAGPLGCGGTWDEAQVQGKDLESLLGHLVAW